MQGIEPVETSLHRHLKERYAVGNAAIEARLGGYRIDVMADDRLVEIQHGSLSAIRDKIASLLRDEHRVLVVKPIVARKTIVRLDRKGGRELGRRASPKKGRILDLFHELVYFTRVFPHPNLVLEAPLVETDEYRYPGHGCRRHWRKGDQVVEDEKLVRIVQIHRFATGEDLLRLLPPGLPSPFHTQDLADHLGVRRWIAQRIAYCLRKMSVARSRQDGKCASLRIPATTACRLSRRRVGGSLQVEAAAA